MTIELPQHLEKTAELLKRSLYLHPQDLAPPIPGELVRDLTITQTPAAIMRSPGISPFEKLRSLVVSPGFGLAAAAMVMLSVLSPSFLSTVPNTQETGSFRGSKVIHTASEATIVLITAEPETRRLLEESGLFDMSRVIETTDPLVAATISTAKLLVDVKGGAIVGYDTDSREILADQLPEDRSDFAERIALAFGALQ
ncbi:hypothetical protein [Haloferula sp.]|uniref:hypothetical protein n=1 Tax=Haloferula sp. TaxID=2497595 RepID=UPI003C7658C6